MAWNPLRKKAAKAATAVPAVTEAPVIVRAVGRDDRRGPGAADTLPRFTTLASDQQGGRGDRFSLLRTKLRHAFTPSQPVADRRFFAGREDVLRSMIRSIEDQRLHVVIYGERGIGKTSLLHVLTQAATDARYIVVYTSCGAFSKFDETFRAAAAEIPLLFHSGFSPTATEAEKGATLADLLPQEPLTPRRFGDLCAKLTGTRVLIILDEFDRVDSGGFRRDIAELIKNLSDRSCRVQLVLAGVAADLTELVEHIPSIRRNIFAMQIPKMSEAEVMQILATGEREADLRFSQEASASIVTVARGSPYLASLLCHHAGNVALDDKRDEVLPNDVARAVALAVQEFEARLPRSVQAQVLDLIDKGRAEWLALAARTALHCDGVFSATDMVATSQVTLRKAEEVLEFLLGEKLIRPGLDQEIGRYVFAQDGLSTLIWMRWANRNLQPEAIAPRRVNA